MVTQLPAVSGGQIHAAVAAIMSDGWLSKSPPF